MFGKKQALAPKRAATVAPQAEPQWLDFLDNSFLQDMMIAKQGGCSGGFGEQAPAPKIDEAQIADRKAAAGELMSSFNIVRNEAEVDGNTVTQEDFDEIVAMYSDIRTGNSNIEIGGNQTGDALAAFKNDTMTDIGRILQTKSGRELLKQTMNGKDKDGNALKTKIGHGAKSTTVAADIDAAKNGQGSSASIQYSPLEATDTLIDGASWGNEVRSDVTLYHELVHAMHMRNGEVSGDRTTEEMNAVGMGSGFPAAHFQYFENRYRHERRMIGHNDVGRVEGDRDMAQRDNYSGGEGGSGDWVTPYTYATDTHRYGER